MLEQHVIDEIKRQVDYYVDAYKEVERLSGELTVLLERVDDIRSNIAAQEKMMSESDGAINALISDIDDDDSIMQVRNAVRDSLSELVSTMVVK